MEKNNYYWYKFVTDVKTYTKTFEECTNKWWIQTLFDGSHSTCTQSQQQFESWVNSLHSYSELYSTKSESEKNFQNSLKTFKDECTNHSENSSGGISVLSGFGLTVFSLSVPWFAYICLKHGGLNHNLNTDKAFIAAATVSGITLATGTGLLGFGVHTIESCQMYSDNKLKSAFIEHVSSLDPYHLTSDSQPAVDSPQSASGDCNDDGNCVLHSDTAISSTSE